MRKLLSLSSLLILPTMGILVTSQPALAEEPDCKTVTTTLQDRPDNGHGTPGIWALDTMDRTVKVCHVVTPQVAAVEIGTWVYSATLSDEGTFTTVPGDTNSPNDGKAVVKQTGTVSGTATFSNFTAPHDWIAWDNSIDGKTYHGTAPAATNDWVSLLWKDGASKTGITDYEWTYKTCSETWVDSSNPKNNDGQDDSAGDITGKACASPSPSPSASSSKAAPVVHSPSPTSKTATLPVTGSNIPYVLGGGVAILAAGSILWILGRRRRTRFEA